MGLNSSAHVVLLSSLLVGRSGWSCAAAGCCTGTTTSPPPDALAQPASPPLVREAEGGADHDDSTRGREKCQEAASDLVSGSRFLFWVQLISFFVLLCQHRNYIQGGCYLAHDLLGLVVAVTDCRGAFACFWSTEVAGGVAGGGAGGWHCIQWRGGWAGGELLHIRGC